MSQRPSPSDSSVFVRIPKEWRERLRVQATREFRTVSGIIKQALSEYFDRQDAAKKK